MIVLEAKLKGRAGQYALIDEAIRTSLFCRNKALRYWMDNEKVNSYDLNKQMAVLAKEFEFAGKLNSQARQSGSERAWSGIARFFDNCLVRRADGYYAQFCLDVVRTETITPSQKAVGLDVGLNHFYTDSQGDVIENPRHLRKLERKLKKLQRKVSKRKKGSANRRKAVKRLARKHLKISRQRKDFAVKTARYVVRSNDLIAYEDLQVRNMVKNHKLAKSISDASWSMFREWVEYFGKVYGKVTIAVPPQYTSQNCSTCGTLVKKTLSTRTHCCGHCGTVLDRDHNAALNILASGLNRVGHTQINAWGEFDLCQVDASLVDKLSH